VFHYLALDLYISVSICS